MPGGRVIPLSVIATWPSPNYVNPVSQGSYSTVLTIIWLVLVIVIFGGRIWARFKILRSPGWDDYIAIVATVLAVGLDIHLLFVINHVHLGRHVWDVPVPLYITAGKSLWVLQVIFHAAQGLIKISVFLFYLRLTTGSHSRIMIYCTQGMIAFQALWIVVLEIVLLNACHPLEAYWLQLQLLYPVSYSCTNEAVYTTLAGVVAVITDFTAVLLPCWLISGLHLPRRQKQLLYAVFGAGILVSICGIFRLAFTIRSFYLTFDIFWESNYLVTATVFELNGAIIYASVPALKPLFDRYLKEKTTTSTSTPQRKVQRRVVEDRAGGNHKVQPHPVGKYDKPLPELPPMSEITAKSGGPSFGTTDDSFDLKSFV